MSTVIAANEWARISRQSKELYHSAANLKTRLKVLGTSGAVATLYKDDKTSTAFQGFAQNAVRQLCKSYRQLHDTLENSDRLTTEGKALLDEVKQLLTGSEAEKFAAMGLTLNRYTGELKFDEAKFSEQIAANPSEVRKLLLDKKYLAPVMNGVVDYILGQGEMAFFNSAYRSNALLDVQA